MIAIIDSGIANLRSVEKGFEKVGVPARVVREPRLLRDAGFRGVTVLDGGMTAWNNANLETVT